jgi:hypothetical protein
MAYEVQVHMSDVQSLEDEIVYVPIKPNITTVDPLAQNGQDIQLKMHKKQGSELYTTMLSATQ